MPVAFFRSERIEIVETLDKTIPKRVVLSAVLATVKQAEGRSGEDTHSQRLQDRTDLKLKSRARVGITKLKPAGVVPSVSALENRVCTRPIDVAV